MHASLAAEAADGEQILVQDTDHYIQVHQPGEVVQAILAVLPPTSP
jgi:hypothetical protein